MEWLKSRLYFIAICLVILASLCLFAKIVEAPIIVNPAEAKEAEPARDDLDRLIDQLAWCESRNNPLIVNPADPDTRSVGLLQFKDETFWRYNQIYKVVPDLEKHEVANVIFDGDIQRALAKEILKDGGWKNWYNCLKPYYL